VSRLRLPAVTAFGPELLQQAFDAIGTWANGNIGADNITNGQVVEVQSIGSSTRIAYGTLAAVNSDGGGWCNYTLSVFPTALDFIVAQNNFGGASGAAFAAVQVQTATTFRCFVNAAGLNCACSYLAFGH
jgi:hypothetical protein